MYIRDPQIFIHTSIVYAQKLILSGGHVDDVRLSLRALLIEELVY